MDGPDLSFLNEFLPGSPVSDDPVLEKLRKARERLKQVGVEVPDDIPFDFDQVTGHESSRSHFNKNGQVKRGVKTRTGEQAIGYSQIMPGTAERWKKMGLDPFDEIDNIAMGMGEFFQGADDKIGRRIAYVGGPHSTALAQYKQTGKIPTGKLYSYLPKNKETFKDYIQKTGGFNDFSELNQFLSGGTAPPTGVEVSDFDTAAFEQKNRSPERIAEWNKEFPDQPLEGPKRLGQMATDVAGQEVAQLQPAVPQTEGQVKLATAQQITGEPSTAVPGNVYADKPPTAGQILAQPARDTKTGLPVIPAAGKPAEAAAPKPPADPPTFETWAGGRPKTQEMVDAYKQQVIAPYEQQFGQYKAAVDAHNKSQPWYPKFEKFTTERQLDPNKPETFKAFQEFETAEYEASPEYQPFKAWADKTGVDHKTPAAKEAYRVHIEKKQAEHEAQPGYKKFKAWAEPQGLDPKKKETQDAWVAHQKEEGLKKLRKHRDYPAYKKFLEKNPQYEEGSAEASKAYATLMRKANVRSNQAAMRAVQQAPGGEITDVQPRYEFQDKGELVLPPALTAGGIGIEGKAYKYDETSQEGTQPGQFRVTDPETNEAFIYDPKNRTFLSEAGLKVVKEIAVPLFDKEEVWNKSTAEGVWAATIAKELKADPALGLADVPKKDIVDYFSVNTINWETKQPETLEGFYKSTKPDQALGFIKDTETYHVTQKDIDNILDYSKKKADTTKRYNDSVAYYSQQPNLDIYEIDSKAKHAAGLTTNEYHQADMAAYADKKNRVDMGLSPYYAGSEDNPAPSEEVKAQWLREALAADLKTLKLRFPGTQTPYRAEAEYDRAYAKLSKTDKAYDAFSSLISVIPQAGSAISKTAGLLEMHGYNLLERLNSAMGGQAPKPYTDIRETLLYRGGREWDWIESGIPRDPRLRHGVWSQAANSIGQVGLMAALTSVTGGITTAGVAGASMGAAEAIDQSIMDQATPGQQLGLAAIAAIAAMPDLILMKGWFKGLTKGESVGLFRKIGQTMFKGLAPKLGEEGAEQVVRNGMRGLIQRAGQLGYKWSTNVEKELLRPMTVARRVGTIGKAVPGESVQETVEGKTNKIAQKAILGKDIPWADIITLNAEDAETALYGGIGGFGGGAIEVATNYLNARQGEKAYEKVMAELLRQRNVIDKSDALRTQLQETQQRVAGLQEEWLALSNKAKNMTGHRRRKLDDRVRKLAQTTETFIGERDAAFNEAIRLTGLGHALNLEFQATQPSPVDRATVERLTPAENLGTRRLREMMANPLDALGEGLGPEELHVIGPQSITASDILGSGPDVTPETKAAPSPAELTSGGGEPPEDLLGGKTAATQQTGPAPAAATETKAAFEPGQPVTYQNPAAGAEGVGTVDSIDKKGNVVIKTPDGWTARVAPGNVQLDLQKKAALWQEPQKSGLAAPEFTRGPDPNAKDYFVTNPKTGTVAEGLTLREAKAKADEFSKTRPGDEHTRVLPMAGTPAAEQVQIEEGEHIPAIYEAKGKVMSVRKGRAAAPLVDVKIGNRVEGIEQPVAAAVQALNDAGIRTSGSGFFEGDKFKRWMVQVDKPTGMGAEMDRAALEKMAKKAGMTVEDHPTQDDLLNIALSPKITDTQKKTAQNRFDKFAKEVAKESTPTSPDVQLAAVPRGTGLSALAFSLTRRREEEGDTLDIDDLQRIFALPEITKPPTKLPPSFYTDITPVGEKWGGIRMLPRTLFEEVEPIGPKGDFGWIKYSSMQHFLQPEFSHDFEDLVKIVLGDDPIANDWAKNGSHKMRQAVMTAVLDTMANSVGPERSSRLTAAQWDEAIVKISGEGGVKESVTEGLVAAGAATSEWHKNMVDFLAEPYTQTLIEKARQGIMPKPREIHAAGAKYGPNRQITTTDEHGKTIIIPDPNRLSHEILVRTFKKAVSRKFPSAAVQRSAARANQGATRQGTEKGPGDVSLSGLPELDQEITKWQRVKQKIVDYIQSKAAVPGLRERLADQRTARLGMVMDPNEARRQLYEGGEGTSLFDPESGMPYAGGSSNFNNLAEEAEAAATAVVDAHYARPIESYKQQPFTDLSAVFHPNTMAIRLREWDVNSGYHWPSWDTAKRAATIDPEVLAAIEPKLKEIYANAQQAMKEVVAERGRAEWLKSEYQSVGRSPIYEPSDIETKGDVSLSGLPEELDKPQPHQVLNTIKPYTILAMPRIAQMADKAGQIHLSRIQEFADEGKGLSEGLRVLLKSAVSALEGQGQKTVNAETFKAALALQALPLYTMTTDAESSYRFTFIGPAHYRRSGTETHLYNTSYELQSGPKHFSGDFTYDIVPWETGEVVDEETGQTFYFAYRTDRPAPPPDSKYDERIGIVNTDKKLVENWTKDREEAVGLDPGGTVAKGQFGHDRSIYDKKQGVWIGEIQSDLFNEFFNEDKLGYVLFNMYQTYGSMFGSPQALAIANKIMEIEVDAHVEASKLGRSELRSDILLGPNAVADRLDDDKQALTAATREVALAKGILAIPEMVETLDKIATNYQLTNDEQEANVKYVIKQFVDDPKYRMNPLWSDYSLDTIADAITEVFPSVMMKDQTLEKKLQQRQKMDQGRVDYFRDRANKSAKFFSSNKVRNLIKRAWEIPEMKKQMIKASDPVVRQLVAHRQNYMTRIMREAIRREAYNGKKWAYIPTPRTVALMNNFISKAGPPSATTPYDVVEAEDPRELVVGDQVTMEGAGPNETYRVVELDQANEEFLVAPLDAEGPTVRLMQPYAKNRVTTNKTPPTFNIKELSPQQQTIVEKYVALSEQFKKDRPDAEIITDDFGNEWMQTKITDEDKGDVVVFNAAKKNLTRENAAAMRKLDAAGRRNITSLAKSHGAKIGLDGVLEVSAEGLEILHRAMKTAQPGYGRFLGLHLGGKEADSVFKAIHGLAAKERTLGHKEAAAHLDALAEIFKNAQHGFYGDVSIVGDFGEGLSATTINSRIEEQAHRAFYRARYNSGFPPFNNFLAVDAYNRTVSMLRERDAYKNMGDKQLHNEVVSKLFRHDALEELEMNQGERNLLKGMFFTQLIDHGVTPREIIEHYEGVESEYAKEFTETARDLERAEAAAEEAEAQKGGPFGAATQAVEDRAPPGGPGVQQVREGPVSPEETEGRAVPEIEVEGPTDEEVREPGDLTEEQEAREFVDQQRQLGREEPYESPLDRAKLYVSYQGRPLSEGEFEQDDDAAFDPEAAAVNDVASLMHTMDPDPAEAIHLFRQMVEQNIEKITDELERSGAALDTNLANDMREQLAMDQSLLDEVNKLDPADFEYHPPVQEVGGDVSMAAPPEEDDDFTAWQRRLGRSKEPSRRQPSAIVRYQGKDISRNQAVRGMGTDAATVRGNVIRNIADKIYRHRMTPEAAIEATREELQSAAEYIRTQPLDRARGDEVDRQIDAELLEQYQKESDALTQIQAKDFDVQFPVQEVGEDVSMSGLPKLVEAPPPKAERTVFAPPTPAELEPTALQERAQKDIAALERAMRLAALDEVASRSPTAPPKRDREGEGGFASTGFLYEGERDVTIYEAIVNLIRTGYLAGFSIVKTNLYGNSLNLIMEELVRAASLPVDILRRGAARRGAPGLEERLVKIDADIETARAAREVTANNPDLTKKQMKKALEKADKAIDRLQRARRHQQTIYGDRSQQRTVPTVSPIDILNGLFGPTGALREGLGRGERGLMGALLEGVKPTEAHKTELAGPMVLESEEETDEDRKYVRNFGVPALDMLIEFVKRVAVGIDRPFKAYARTSYARGARRMMAQNQVTQGLEDNWREAAEKIKDTGLEKIIQKLSDDYARMVTFQNPNVFTDFIGKGQAILLNPKMMKDIGGAAIAAHGATEHIGGALYVATGAVFPFVRTPTNIGLRALEYTPAGLGLAVLAFHKIGNGYDRAKAVDEINVRRSKEEAQINRARDAEKKRIMGNSRALKAEYAEVKSKLNQQSKKIRASKMYTEVYAEELVARNEADFAKWEVEFLKRQSGETAAAASAMQAAQARYDAADAALQTWRATEDSNTDVQFSVLENQKFAATAARFGIGTTLGALTIMGVMRGLIEAVGRVGWGEDDEDEQKRKEEMTKGAIPNYSVQIGGRRYPYDKFPFGIAAGMGVDFLEQMQREGTAPERGSAAFWKLAHDVQSVFPITDTRFVQSDLSSVIGNYAKSVTPFVNLKINQELGNIFDPKQRTSFNKGFLAQYGQQMPIPFLREALVPESKMPFGGPEYRGTVGERALETIFNVPRSTVPSIRQSELPIIPLESAKPTRRQGRQGRAGRATR